MRNRGFDNIGTMPTNGRSAKWSVCLLFFFLAVTCAGAPSGQINGLAVSPDGKLIVVTFDNGDTHFIYKVSVDAGNASRLTKAEAGWESCPSFSSDGRQIVYSYKPGKEARSRIIIANLDGSDVHQWSASGVSDIWPSLTPDNRTIIFSRSESYGSDSPIAQPHHHSWDFYASDLDGSNVRQLTNESFYMASPASVSPDGKSMVVVTEGFETSQQIAIYSITHPGQPLHTFQPHVPKEVDRRNPIFTFPNYLPDGSLLFMAANRHMDYDVYRLNPDTGTIEKLTNGNGYATDLRVSADGNTAVFLKWRKNWLGDLIGNQVYLLDLQSHKLTPLKVNGLN
jgi:Tol biopolymer transport system component